MQTSLAGLKYYHDKNYPSRRSGYHNYIHECKHAQCQIMYNNMQCNTVNLSSKFKNLYLK